MFNRLLVWPVVASAVLTVLLVGCGGSDTDIEALATEAADVAPQARHTLVAEDLEFDTDTIVVPASETISIELDNQDSGVLHNVSIYYTQDAHSDVFKGDLFTGIETREYTFPAPEPGVYLFKCDAHPEMNGAFIVK